MIIASKELCFGTASFSLWWWLNKKYLPSLPRTHVAAIFFLHLHRASATTASSIDRRLGDQNIHHHRTLKQENVYIRRDHSSSTHLRNSKAQHQAATPVVSMNDADLGDNIDEYGREVDGRHSKENAEHKSGMEADRADHVEPRSVVALPRRPFQPSASQSVINACV